MMRDPSGGVSDPPTLNDVSWITGKQLRTRKERAMFFQLIGYRLRCLLRDKELVFWTAIRN